MTSPSLAPPPRDADRQESDPAETSGWVEPVRPASRPPGRERFLGWPLWLSLAVHSAVLLLFVLLMRYGPPARLVEPRQTGTVHIVDLAFPAGEPVEAASETTPTPAPAARRPEEERDVLLPSRVPSGGGAPEPVPEQAAGAGGGAAPGGAGGSVGDRLRPGFSDPRLYVDPKAPSIPPRGVKSDHQRYVEHLQKRIDAINDSLYAATPHPNTDWTVKDKEGRKWGLSEEGLHLGGLTVPKGILPVPRATGTNKELEEARERQRARDEIRRQEEARERREAQKEQIERTRAREERERASSSGSGG